MDFYHQALRPVYGNLDGNTAQWATVPQEVLDRAVRLIAAKGRVADARALLSLYLPDLSAPPAG